MASWGEVTAPRDTTHAPGVLLRPHAHHPHPREHGGSRLPARFCRVAQNQPDRVRAAGCQTWRRTDGGEKTLRQHQGGADCGWGDTENPCKQTRTQHGSWAAPWGAARHPHQVAPGGPRAPTRACPFGNPLTETDVCRTFRKICLPNSKSHRRVKGVSVQWSQELRHQEQSGFSGVTPSKTMAKAHWSSHPGTNSAELNTRWFGNSLLTTSFAACWKTPGTCKASPDMGTDRHHGAAPGSPGAGGSFLVPALGCASCGAWCRAGVGGPEVPHHLPLHREGSALCVCGLDSRTPWPAPWHHLPIRQRGDEAGGVQGSRKTSRLSSKERLRLAGGLPHCWPLIAAPQGKDRATPSGAPGTSRRGREHSDTVSGPAHSQGRCPSSR